MRAHMEGWLELVWKCPALPLRELTREGALHGLSDLPRGLRPQFISSAAPPLAILPAPSHLSVSSPAFPGTAFQMHFSVFSPISGFVAEEPEGNTIRRKRMISLGLVTTRKHGLGVKFLNPRVMLHTRPVTDRS